MCKRDDSCTVEVGKGKASLGCLVPKVRPYLHIDRSGKVKMAFADGQYGVVLSVTDLRFYESDHVTPRRAVVERVAGRIKSGVGIVLCVGLTRPWQKRGDIALKHWLQLNNVHLEDDPAWGHASEHG